MSDFLAQIDAAIIRGDLSNAKLAHKLGIAETTIRRRKAVLRRSGLLPSNLQAVEPEAHHAITTEG